MKSVFISILNFNGRKNTIECLRSINKLSRNGLKINVVVVDNDSSERFSIDQGILDGISLKVIFNKKNLGFSGGQNIGIRYAFENNAAYVLVLNNDTKLDEDIVYRLVEAAQTDKLIGIISPKIYFAKGYEFHKDMYSEKDLGKVIWYAGGLMDWKNVLGKHRGVDEVDKGQYEKTEETDFATGCCMLIKKEVFEKTGYFDERYFLYYEDNDFSQRVKSKGYKIIYEPKGILWHRNAGSSGGSGSTLQDYYITRNRLLFGMKYAPVRSQIALLRESFKTLIKGRRWQKKGVLDFYLRRFGKGNYLI